MGNSFDRRIGDALRQAVSAVPGGGAAGHLASEALAPGVRALLVAMLVRGAGRRAGAEAVVAGISASVIAREMRDRIGRPRPGGRTEGGFPSRHAAAAVAIARAVSRRHPALGRCVAAAAVAGLAGRVVTGHHDPADIIAGAGVGWAVDATVERLIGGLR